jgi:hypothetical protein
MMMAMMAVLAGRVMLVMFISIVFVSQSVDTHTNKGVFK